AVWRLVRSWTDSTFPLFCSSEDWDSWFNLWRASKDKSLGLIPSSRLLVGLSGVIETISHSTLIP
ncbi:hypothetical protein Tco_0736872, partial [Tanacetum coccineum]